MAGARLAVPSAPCHPDDGCARVPEGGFVKGCGRNLAVSTLLRAFSLGAGAPAMTILSLFCLLSGAVLAGLAPRRSVQQAALESAGGGLFVLGLVIIGAGLPLFR
jgi:hypothetical protein